MQLWGPIPSYHEVGHISSQENPKAQLRFMSVAVASVAAGRYSRNLRVYGTVS